MCLTRWHHYLCAIWQDIITIQWLLLIDVCGKIQYINYCAIDHISLLKKSRHIVLSTMKEFTLNSQNSMCNLYQSLIKTLCNCSMIRKRLAGGLQWLSLTSSMLVRVRVRDRDRFWASELILITYSDEVYLKRPTLAQIWIKFQVVEQCWTRSKTCCERGDLER